MAHKNILGITGQIYKLLQPLNPEDRQKVFAGVLGMLGETVPAVAAVGGMGKGPAAAGFGTKAAHWMQSNNLTKEELQSVFELGDGSIELLAVKVPGKTKKEQSINSYLLVGTKSLLAGDDPKFADKEAVVYCKQTGCHDVANHASTRASLGSKVSGNKSTGFRLSTPGLQAAAQLIKQIAKG
jgi:hypothetical protein